MRDLVFFEWQRDMVGYAFDGEGWLHPKSGVIETYRPLEQSPGIFAEFAELDGTRESFVTFAKKYGPLERPHQPVDCDDSGPNAALEQQPLRGCSLSVWEKSHREMSDLFKQFGEARNRRDFSMIMESFKGSDFEGRFRVELALRPEGSHPFLSLCPKSLYDAFFVQFSLVISGIYQLRRCEHCPTWFTYGTGTGRRSTANFCSKQCWTAYNRAHQKTLEMG